MRSRNSVRFLMVGLFALFLSTLSVPVSAQTPSPAPSDKAQPLTKLPPNRPEKGMVFDGLVPAQSGPCVGMFQVGKHEVCTHGPDESGLAQHVARSVAPVETVAPNDAIICDGDGVSGKRTQVMYVRASDRADRYASYLASFRTWAADMDTIYKASAAETGGVRNVRYVTDANCAVSVLNIVISAAGDDTFDKTISEVAAKGYTSANRKYLMFVDANVYCGIGGIQNDDRNITTNRNDTTTSYARVDAGCWGGSTAAHENMHNIGGVQLSAPHTSRGWHCVDEYDLMCYSDSPNYPAMQYICTDRAHDTRFDCNHDDYFHTSPPAGSYLATHWNSANSAFLIQPGGGTAPATPANLRVSGATASSVSLAWSDTSNETSYSVYKWQYINGQWAWGFWVSVGANATAYANTGLGCGTTHYYRIAAKNSAGESAPTAWVQGNTAACANAQGPADSRGAKPQAPPLP
ncbi:MAG TPA: fibronectin type III domain-containing protein [Herpetosiphonaceae bacterium]